MTIEIITAFKTTDGTVFENENRAEAHKTELDLKIWYRNNLLYGSYGGSEVNFDDLVEWLNVNKSEVQQLIGDR